MDSDEHENRTPHNIFFEINLCKNRSFIEAETYVEGGMFAVVATLCVSLHSLHSYRAYGLSIEDPPYVSPTSTLIGLAVDEFAFACRRLPKGLSELHLQVAGKINSTSRSACHVSMLVLE